MAAHSLFPRRLNHAPALGEMTKPDMVVSVVVVGFFERGQDLIEEVACGYLDGIHQVLFLSSQPHCSFADERVESRDFFVGVFQFDV